MLDDFTQKELREKYNPEGSILRRHQMRLLDILTEVDKICRRYNLKYWLCSGTLLGAIRHGGFIPWDDDIDIEMEISDYKKLLEILPKELPNWLVLQTNDTDPGYFLTFAKVRDLHSHLVEHGNLDKIFKYQGVFIDIFPLEQSNELLRRMGRKLWLASAQIAKSDIWDDAQKVRKIHRMMQWNQHKVIPFLRVLAKIMPTKFYYGFGTPFHIERKKEFIFPIQEMEFEGRRFFIPYDSDSFLRSQFGDYWKLPETIENHTETVSFDKIKEIL